MYLLTFLKLYKGTIPNKYTAKKFVNIATEEELAPLAY